LFKGAISAPLLLENDTALVGLGELAARRQAGGGVPAISAYFTVSTGVNGVRFMNESIDRSTYGFELGRQLIEVSNNNVITLEDTIGGRAMQRRFGRLPKSVDDPAVWQEETRRLAIALYNLMLHWSPQTITLGGSMMRDIPLAELTKQLHRLPSVYPQWPLLQPAMLEDKGGLYGALELARQTTR
jgi:predicted NBD/HSP70 family sugar kinase